jgi:hypothetical protein
MFLSQEKYVNDVLKKFNMDICKPISTLMQPKIKLLKEMPLEFDVKKKEMSKIPYSNVFGSLMYCMVCTKPNISYVLSRCSPLGSNQKNLRYLQCTRTFGIEFKGNM